MGILDRMIGRTVEKYLASMLRSGRTDAEFPNLVFDAARVYAQNNGGTLYPDTPHCIGCDKEFAGKNYWVFFMRGRSGRGTSVSLQQQASALEQVEEHVNAVIALGCKSSHEGAKAGITDTDFQAAMSKLEELPESVLAQKRPSWNEDASKTEPFMQGAIEMLQGTEIPPAYWAMMFKTSGSRDILLAFIAILEDDGCTFAHQQDGAVEFVRRGWDRLDPAHKPAFEAFGRL